MPTSMPTSMDEGPLSGVRVLDLSQDVAGPYCAKLMAGLGAGVIKVEPLQGDPSRRSGPFPQDIPHRETSALFLYLNTGKLGVTLDLTTRSGQKVLGRLLAGADVLVESFTPGEAESLGVGYRRLEAEWPGLVVASITPFGQAGPYRDYKAREINLYAAGGLMYITGDPEREPLKMGLPVSQYMAGQHALVAVMAALWSVAYTGQGQQVDISVAECNAALEENAIGNYNYSGHIVSRMGDRGYGRAAHGIYPCRDGYVGVLAQPDQIWPAMAELMEEPRLGDPRYATRQGRQDYADEVESLMLPWLMRHDKEDIFKRGQEAGFGFSLVETPGDLLECEQLLERNYFVDIEHREAGELRYPGPPFRISGTSWVNGPAPLLGEHNEEVYCRLLGYSRQDLVLLRQSGVI